MLSARPFWILFSLCVIILVEWLVVPHFVDILITKEIVSAGISVGEAIASIEEAGIKVPDILKQRGPSELVRIGDVQIAFAEMKTPLPQKLEIFLKSHEPEESVRIEDIQTALSGSNLDLPPKIKFRNKDDLLTKNELDFLDFRTKWHIINSKEPLKALVYVGLLIVLGILVGFLIASVAFRHLVQFGDRLSRMSSTDKIAVLLGLIIGLMVSLVLLPNILQYIHGPGPIVGIITAGVIVYLSIWAMMSMKDELKSYFPGVSKSGELERAYQKPKLLDTNVIIDGRIADICKTGFIEGQILVPSFIVEELQHIADCADNLKRARGRRGLEILTQMRKEMGLAVKQVDPVDPANAEEVDVRLVKLAKEIDASIVTNDYNLNKVAEIHGVTVLNINELANALKPVVLPGEEMSVTIIKEGKEPQQGIGYLDDGTMVVVESGRDHIGETVDVVVTSVLQTIAGRMIFTNLKAIQDEEDEQINRNVRNYSSIRPRKKTH
jgi:uncharacterized protein YacL